MSAPILKLHIDERDNISVLVSQDVQVLTCEEADRIEDEYKRMQAENAKLREEFDKMDVWHSKELTAVMDENAKLREISSIMLKCIKANERRVSICLECPMHKQFDELRSYCCLEHEAKKLGIGVKQ